ncbi:hypothetical protein LWI29_028880 [Acer saccharum]|uniref:Uncharacterized protein n=1 Tax=Acer saccharum TaxID=4024 RepID=A0AA39RDY8_ACESA|nr:hypothetical protein LWI29_028880 [Acer saccharum]
MSSPPTSLSITSLNRLSSSSSAVTISLDHVSPSVHAFGRLPPSSSTAISLGHLSPFLLHPPPLIQSKEKKVGKVSIEWLACEKTKLVGTFPPKKRSWTGYVEKDIAGSSSDGAENTVVVAAGIALISIAAASSILLQVGKNAQQKIFQYPLLYIIV